MTEFTLCASLATTAMCCDEDVLHRPPQNDTTLAWVKHNFRFAIFGCVIIAIVIKTDMHEPTSNEQQTTNGNEQQATTIEQQSM